MSDWAELQLSDICNLISSKTSMTNASLGNYVSTENMVPNFGGLVKAEKLPSGTMVNAFLTEDVLFSNIRTYFKKVWSAQFEGTVSADVLVFRAKQICDPKFLYYTLCEPDFTEYTVLTSRGAKMPRGDKEAILSYKLGLPPLTEQKAIASVLSSLDDKIDLLHRQNKTLEAMAETLFRQWFIEEAKEDWEEVPLSDYFKVKHGYAFKGEFITPEPTKYRLVTPGNFEIGGGFKSAKFKYYSSDVIPEDYVFDELDFVVTMTDLSKEGDTLGYPAFIPLHHKDEVLYLHNQRVGKMQFHNEKECKFFFYMLMKQDVYQQFIIGSCTGTSVKHTSPTTIGSFNFAKPPQERMWEFNRIVGQQFAKIFQNQRQIQTLEKLRDTLLPKLMSGEVRVQYPTEEVA